MNTHELAEGDVMRDDCPKSPDGEHDLQMVQLPWPRLTESWTYVREVEPGEGVCNATR